jgi:Cu/Ag efflux protein CusF
MKLKSGITFLLGAALLIFLSVLPQAATAAAGVSASKGNQADGSITQTFTGTVVKVDGKSGKLTMKTGDNRQKEFSVDSKTTLTLRSTNSKLSDLKPGEQIIVTAEGNKADSVVLSTVNLQRGPGSGRPYSIQANVPDANEPMKNKGVNPYGPLDSRADAQAANRQEQGLRDLPPTSAQSTAQSSTGASSPAPPPTSSPSGGANEQTTEKVSGTVVSVDAPANLITLKTREGRLRVFVTDFNTKYNLTSAAGMLADLKAGQPITIIAHGMKVLSVDASTSAQ